MSKTNLAYRWDHVHIMAGDPEAMGQWFGDAFGATIERIPPRVIARLPGLAILINPVPEGAPEGAGGQTRTGYDHICFEVDDIEAAVADLTARGAGLRDAVREIRAGVKIAFVTGPEMIVVELVERRG